MLVITATAVCIKLFYKTYQVKRVAQSADLVITINKKNIINTLLWDALTTPSQWNLKSIFSSAKKDSSWLQMVDLPDYIFLFHSAGQPGNIYYSVNEIDGEKDFSNGLKKYHFTKTEITQLYEEYYSAENGVALIKNGNTFLAAFLQPDQFSYASKTAIELFKNQQYISKAIVEKTINVSSHVACWVKKNEFLQADAVLKANFDKEQININGSLTPATMYQFKEADFSYSDSCLANIAFVKPSGAAWSILPENFKRKLSNMLSGNADSLLSGNAAMQLSLQSIKPKIDSAITYIYDDDFNKIEKVVVDNIMEPSLQISIKGDSVNRLYEHWRANQKTEVTPAGELLVLMPFVKSYITGKSPSVLEVTSYNFSPLPGTTTIKSIAFCYINFDKIPDETKKYFPDGLLQFLQNIDKGNLVLRNTKAELELEITLRKKQNDLPVIVF